MELAQARPNKSQFQYQCLEVREELSQITSKTHHILVDLL